MLGNKGGGGYSLSTQNTVLVVRAHNSGAFHWKEWDHLFDRPGLTRVMLQKALELLVLRVFEPPTTDRTEVIRIAR
jgi:hypothetical protein